MAQLRPEAAGRGQTQQPAAAQLHRGQTLVEQGPAGPLAPLRRHVGPFQQGLNGRPLGRLDLTQQPVGQLCQHHPVTVQIGAEQHGPAGAAAQQQQMAGPGFGGQREHGRTGMAQQQVTLRIGRVHWFQFQPQPGGGGSGRQRIDDRRRGSDRITGRAGQQLDTVGQAFGGPNQINGYGHRLSERRGRRVPSLASPTEPG